MSREAPLFYARMAVSLRLMIAVFCIFLVVTPPALITLQTQAVDDTLQTIVPSWHHAVLQLNGNMWARQLLMLARAFGPLLTSQLLALSESPCSLISNASALDRFCSATSCMCGERNLVSAYQQSSNSSYFTTVTSAMNEAVTSYAAFSPKLFATSRDTSPAMTIAIQLLVRVDYSPVADALSPVPFVVVSNRTFRYSGSPTVDVFGAPLDGGSNQTEYVAVNFSACGGVSWFPNIRWRPSFVSWSPACTFAVVVTVQPSFLSGDLDSVDLLETTWSSPPSSWLVFMHAEPTSTSMMQDVLWCGESSGCEENGLIQQIPPLRLFGAVSSEWARIGCTTAVGEKQGGWNSTGICWELGQDSSCVFNEDRTMVTIVSMRLLTVNLTSGNWIEDHFHLGLVVYDVNLVGSNTMTVEGKQATSVIVGVTTCAAAIVVVLATFQVLFHPLKVVGTTLRQCADIDLAAIEDAAPSCIKQVYRIQRHVDLLVQRVIACGKYMPDKSQLSVILDDERSDLEHADASRTALTVSKPNIFGAVPCSVTVDVEYRSRRNLRLKRGKDDLRKRCVFALMYSSDEDVFAALLSQCCQRLGERVGEPLEIRLKLPDVNEYAVPVDQCPVLTTSEEVLRAIQSCQGSTLFLYVLKRSTKQYGCYVSIVLTFAATIAVSRVGSTWLEDSAASVRRSASVILLCVCFQLAINVTVAMLLLRKFVQWSGLFSLWMQTAIHEAVLAALCATVAVVNLLLIFSCTRITRKLRFNAPLSERFPLMIIYCSAPGNALAFVVPFGLVLGHCANTTRLYSAESIIAVVLCLAAVTDYAWRVYAEVWLTGRHKQLFGHADLGVVDAPDQENAALPMATAAPDVQSDDGEYLAVVGEISQPVQLSLLPRTATVVSLTLEDHLSHFAAMPIVDVQELCSEFLSCVLVEARRFGGLVLSMRVPQVQLGFGCHRSHPTHLLSAVECFFAVESSMKKRCSVWKGFADGSQPAALRVIGAVVSGTELVLGFAGSHDLRAFQHMGGTANILDQLFRVGCYLRAQLTTTSETAHAALAAMEVATVSRSTVQPVVGPMPSFRLIDRIDFGGQIVEVCEISTALSPPQVSASNAALAQLFASDPSAKPQQQSRVLQHYLEIYPGDIVMKRLCPRFEVSTENRSASLSGVSAFHGELAANLRQQDGFDIAMWQSSFIGDGGRFADDDILMKPSYTVQFI